MKLQGGGLRGGGGEKGASKVKGARIVLPLCVLFVLFVWNSPTTLAPFDGAYTTSSSESSSRGPSVVVIEEYKAQEKGLTSAILYEEGNEESDSLNPEEEVITAQYDNLMTQIPLQLTQEQANAADLKSAIAQKPPEASIKASNLAEPSIKEKSNLVEPSIKEESNPEASKEKNVSPGVGVGESVISGNRSDDVNKAIWNIYEDIKSVSLPYSTRTQGSDSSSSSCEGKRIFVYDLPSEFNTDLAARCDTLFPWLSLCDFFVDSGRGTPANSVENGTQVFVPGDKWFNTHQYALEMVSHARVLKYRCRTEDPEEADLFYVPYYGGLDVIRWHFQANATNERRDELGLRLVRWLEGEEAWRKNGGRDHVLVLGKISWDFRRQVSGQWGSRLLTLPSLHNTTRVLIERDPWSPHDIGVPHPTYFHPTSSTDIDAWLHHVHTSTRTALVTFVGKERRHSPYNVRTALVTQCLHSHRHRHTDTYTDTCRFVECDKDNCLNPAFVTKAFLGSHFCMQPVGDSPTRRSVFDSLIAGCIPVLFHPCTAYVQYPWHLPANESSWSVYVSEDEVRAGRVNVVEVLEGIGVERREAMRENIVRNVIPGLVYAAPGGDVRPYRDAFDITVEQLLYRVRQQKGTTQASSS